MKVLIKNKKLLITVSIITILTANLMGYLGAYLLTHYKQVNGNGFGSPRSVNYKLPTEVDLKYVTQRIEINNTEWIDTWLIKQSISNLTILHHQTNWRGCSE